MFEFDAPKFRNFDKTPYRLRSKIIERLLNAEEENRLSDSEIQALKFSSPRESDDEAEYGIDDIDWFQRPHFSHEPSEPPSPPAPLITPITLKKVGLGSPARVIRSNSSTGNNSSTLSSGPTEKTPTRTKRSLLSPLRISSPLRHLEKGNAVKKLVKHESPLHIATPKHKSSVVDDPLLSKSPSPPRLFHDISVLERENDTSNDQGNFSRRNSANLSDIDLFRDELLDLTKKVTLRSPIASSPKADYTVLSDSRQQLKGPRRIMQSSAEESAQPNLATKGNLCPPPNVSTHSNKVLPKRVFARNIQTDDLKKLLKEHNQRIKRR